jgi:hypothetical protein
MKHINNKFSTDSIVGMMYPATILNCICICYELQSRQFQSSALFVFCLGLLSNFFSDHPYSLIVLANLSTSDNGRNYFKHNGSHIAFHPTVVKELEIETDI